MPLGLGFGNPSLGAEGGNDCFTNLLCHFNGVSGTTVFADSSRNAFTLTANGTGQISTTHSEFGGSAVHVVASGNYVTVGNATALLPLGSGSFTVEAWCFVDVAEGSINQPVIGNAVTNVTSTWAMLVRNTGALSVFDGVGNPILNGGSISTGAWHHLAWARDAGNVNYIFVDGNQVATASISQNYSTQATTFIGHTAAVGTDLTGYINEVRISNLARWNGTFTVPNHPYTPF